MKWIRIYSKCQFGNIYEYIYSINIIIKISLKGIIKINSIKLSNSSYECHRNIFWSKQFKKSFKEWKRLHLYKYLSNWFIVQYEYKNMLYNYVQWENNRTGNLSLLPERRVLCYTDHINCSHQKNRIDVFL